MASFGKVLNLLDDRYLELQDVMGNVEPLPTLVPYEEYTQNVLAYRMDTSHEIFLGLIQDFTMRRAHETGKELWTWFVQWEVDNSPPTSQPSSLKKARLEPQLVPALSIASATPRQAPALTIFERRTLDGALMLEEEMLRILIDIVQVTSSLVPNFIEFLYRWVDYYEGDGKALKAALRWEIPSLWDFEYHPLVLPPDMKKEYKVAEGGNTQTGEHEGRSARPKAHNQAAELRQSSPTKKMHARPKPDLAAIELQTFYTEESERLQYREVKFGIQPPKLEQPLPPLINIPRDQRKRTKYYAACFKSRQRALYLLLEAGVTMRQINNYQKLQTVHPKETPEAGDGNGLRNYQKDVKYAQAQFELKEKQIKQREIAISNKLAVEAQLAATHAVPDGAAGLPLIPPTPSYARKPDMAAAMMQRISETRAKKNKDERINIVPKPLMGRLKSTIFKNAKEKPSLMPIRDFMAEAGWYTNSRDPTVEEDGNFPDEANEFVESSDKAGSGDKDDGHNEEHKGGDKYMEDDKGQQGYSTTSTAATPIPNLPRPPLPLRLPLRRPIETTSTYIDLQNSKLSTDGVAAVQHYPFNPPTPPNISAYIRNLNTEQAQGLLALLSPEARQAATERLRESSQTPNPALREIASGIAGHVGAVEPEPESLESRYIRERPLEMPRSRPPPLCIATPFHQGSSAQASSLVNSILDVADLPTSSTAANAPIAVEQQDVESISSSKLADAESRSDLLTTEASDTYMESSPPRSRSAHILGSIAHDNNLTSRATPGAAVRRYPNPASHLFGATAAIASPSHASISISNQSLPPPTVMQQYTSVEGSRSSPVYASSPTSAETLSNNPPPASPATDFNVEYFLYLRRRQDASNLATTTDTSVRYTPPEVPTIPLLRPQPVMAPVMAPEIEQMLPVQRQHMLPADFAAMNAQTPTVQPGPDQSNAQLPQQMEIITRFQSSQQDTWRLPVSRIMSRVPDPPPPILPPLQPQPQPRVIQVVQEPHVTPRDSYTPSTAPIVYPSSSTVMLPPPRPGITRNAPSPLSFFLPKPSPFTTLVPQPLATSPFLDVPRRTETPIQIYLPKILIPGNGIGPGGTKIGNGGCVETDALMLGHEKASGELVLSKALLLPVGVWENTLRKVRSGRWSVLETYPYPGEKKGKEKAIEAAGPGCHAAVYDKLAQAYGMMIASSSLREVELTKRWRVSRGPMVSHDRGAVWEGWAAYVDRDIAMSATEREGALKNEMGPAARVNDGGVGDGCAPYGDAGETARRRREMEELMDEDDDMYGGIGV